MIPALAVFGTPAGLRVRSERCEVRGDPKDKRKHHADNVRRAMCEVRGD